MELTRFFLTLIGLSNLIFKNISINSIDLSYKTVEESVLLLSQKISQPKELNFNYQNQTFSLNTNDINLKTDYLASAQRAYQYTHTGNFFVDFTRKIYLLNKNKDFGLITTYDEEKINIFELIISTQIDDQPTYPNIDIKEGKIMITNGKVGTILDKNKLRSKISTKIAYSNSDVENIPTMQINPKLSDDEIEALRLRVAKIIDKNLEIKFENKTFTKTNDELIKFINVYGGINEDVVNNYISSIASQTEREPQNAKFNFIDNKVTEFQPALDGIKIDKSSLFNLIRTGIETGSLSFELPVKKTSPEISTDKVNNLGIKELIGRGTSTYFHSIPGRVHNVSLAASRINGTLVAPNETFSFNKTLGDVSKFTGYKSAYVILSGKTVLGDGGGVCQVSSTLFRSVLNAGLPIDQRTSHAYRVGYYEQGSSPGFDATVYSPSPDFKFTNNTNNYILITATADPKNYSLVFEIYGTKDGRVVEISKPVILNQIAPGPDIYQDDPSLPIGTVKQVEYRAYGAKVSFNYKVTKDGDEIYKKTFVSNYRPWSAVYLKGTKI